MSDDNLKRLIDKRLRITKAPWADCIGQEVLMGAVVSDMALQGGAEVSFIARHDGEERFFGLGASNAGLWDFEELDPHVVRMRSLIGGRVRVLKTPTPLFAIGTEAKLVAPDPGAPYLASLQRPGVTAGAIAVGITEEDASLWEFEPLPGVTIQFGSAEPGTLAAADEGSPLRRSREVYDHESFVADLDAAVKEIRDLLVQKNQAYGNSALDPLRVFSKASTMEQLFVRIDDKLSRLKRGHAAGEDVVKDLQGYLLLVRVAQMRAEREQVNE